MSQLAPGGMKGELKANNVLFIALFTGVLIFAVIAIVLNYVVGSFLEDRSNDKIFLIVVFALGSISFLSANYMYGKKINEIAGRSLSLHEKLVNYRSILITYLALIEGAALFSIICFLLTGNYIALVVTAIMLIAMFMKRPAKQRLIDELKLDWQEQQELLSL